MKHIVAVLCLMSMQMVKSETAQNITEICMNETGATKDAIIKGKAVLSRDYLCHTACKLKKYNFMTSEHKMDVENIKKTYGSDPIPVWLQKKIRYAEMCNSIVIPDPDMCIAFNQSLHCIAQVVKMNEPVSIKQICMNETGITEEQLIAYSKPEVIKSRSYLCYIACNFKHLDYWKTGNQLNIEKMAYRLKTFDTLKYTKLIQIGKECNGLVKPDDDTCIAFNRTWNCVVLKTNEMIKSEQTPQDVTQICMNEIGATQDAITKGRAVLSRDYLCYIACLYKKHNFTTSENKIDVENIKRAHGSGKRPLPVMVQSIILFADICNKLVIPNSDMCIAYNQTSSCIKSEMKKMRNKAIAVTQICLNETGITEEQVVAYRKPGISRSRGYLCYSVCYMKHFDYWKPGNQLNVEKFAQELIIVDTSTYKKFMQIGKECNGQVKPDDDSCIALNQTLNCIELKRNESRSFSFDIKP